MRIAVTHGEAELALFRLQDIPPERHDAVRARLRSFQRLGLNARSRRGQGKRASYGAVDLVSMALALDLSQLGLTPERTVALLDENSNTIATAVQQAASGFGGEPTYLAFDPIALRGGKTFFRFLFVDELSSWLSEQSAFTRIALINVSAIVGKLTQWFLDIAADLPSSTIADRPRVFLAELSTPPDLGAEDVDP